MSTPNDLKKLEFRVALLERAFTSASAEIAELIAAVSSLTEGAEQHTEQPAPEPITVVPDSLEPFGAGFYRREEDSTGRPFRWTGRGDHFEFRLGIDRTVPWSFAIEIRPNPHIPAELLRLFVDYVEITAEVEGGGRFIRGTIPVRPIGRHAVLTVFLPKTFTPSEIDAKSKDTRTLGLPFYELKLAPVTLATAEGVSARRASNGVDMLAKAEQPGA